MSNSSNPACAICILAGGLSRRMGIPKPRLRLGRRSLLGHARHAAQQTGLPMRIIRQDAVARCGPIGGILTGLSTSTAAAEIFMACDMPFVSSDLLLELADIFRRTRLAAFTSLADQTGFPCIVPTAALGVVEQAIARNQWALHRLAQELAAQQVALSPERATTELMNINTPADLSLARQRLRESRSG